MKLWSIWSEKLSFSFRNCVYREIESLREFPSFSFRLAENSMPLRCAGVLRVEAENSHNQPASSDCHETLRKQFLRHIPGNTSDLIAKPFHSPDGDYRIFLLITKQTASVSVLTRRFCLWCNCGSTLLSHSLFERTRWTWMDGWLKLFVLLEFQTKSECFALQQWGCGSKDLQVVFE